MALNADHYRIGSIVRVYLVQSAEPLDEEQRRWDGRVPTAVESGSAELPDQRMRFLCRGFEGWGHLLASIA